MHAQIVMNHLGDTRHEFDPADQAATARAEERFRNLTARGFRAIALGKNEQPGKLLGDFDPQIEQTLFIPQLEGG
jgi:hypothetical protein